LQECIHPPDGWYWPSREWSLTQWLILAIEGVITHSMADIGHWGSDHSLNGWYWPLREWSLTQWLISAIKSVYTLQMADNNHWEGIYTPSMANIGHQEGDHSLNGRYWPSRRWSLHQWLILAIEGVWNVHIHSQWPTTTTGAAIKEVIMPLMANIGHQGSMECIHSQWPAATIGRVYVVCCVFFLLTLILLFGGAGNGISLPRAPIFPSCGVEWPLDWGAIPAPQLKLPGIEHPK
jgi:hypothetical protein